jgi:hypothetical protein
MLTLPLSKRKKILLDYSMYSGGYLLAFFGLIMAGASVRFGGPRGNDKFLVSP